MRTAMLVLVYGHRIIQEERPAQKYHNSKIRTISPPWTHLDAVPCPALHRADYHHHLPNLSMGILLYIV